MLNRVLFLLGITMMFSFVFSSCDEQDIENNQASRLFRPGSFARSVDGTTVLLSWIPIKNATYYIEYGRASAGTPFSEITEIEKLTLGRVSSYKLENLWGNTRYAIRIKAVSTLDGVNDSEYVTSNFTTGAENIFYPLSYTFENNDFFIHVKWDATKEVTHINVNNLQLGSKKIELTNQQKEAGELIIINDPNYRLRSGQQYTISIYLNDRKRGENSITLQRPA